MKLTRERAQREFAKILPRLVGAYESGRLVPFIGSGLSVGACTNWPTMIERLEQRAGERRGSAARADPRALIARANSAVRALKSSAPGRFEAAMRYAVVARRNTIPAATRSLAAVWWPLVLTTNYDNCFVAAFRERYPGELHAVVGRRPEHCQRVLTSLSNPGRPLLWALQGHMNVPCQIAGYVAPPELERELVVGHEEYRRVTYRDLGFRRAFAEVFRQRSLLFLGAGVKETYLQELFGEVLEIYGPSSRPHYAIMPRGEVDPDFMLSRFQIRVIEFPDGAYDLIPSWLGEFVSATRVHTQRPLVWGFGGARRGQWHNPASLEIVRGYLPRQQGPRECIAISPVQRSGRFVISRALASRLKAWRVDPGRQPVARTQFVHEYSGSDVFLIRARTGASPSSLTAVYDAALSLFRTAGRGYDTIHMQLPATGAGRIAGGQATPDVNRSFPARFSLIQTVRGWSALRARNPTAHCRLVLHTLAESVTMEIAAGRLDVLELLSCEDVRFSTEILRDDGSVERRVFELPLRTTRLAAVIEQLDLSSRQWTVEVSPLTNLHPKFRAERRVTMCVGQRLDELGVVPGSTLHFRRTRSAR